MKKQIAIAFIVILVANLVLLGLQMIGVYLFWAIIIVAALVAFLLLPRIK